MLNRLARQGRLKTFRTLFASLSTTNKNVRNNNLPLRMEHIQSSHAKNPSLSNALHTHVEQETLSQSMPPGGVHIEFHEYKVLSSESLTHDTKLIRCVPVDPSATPKMIQAGIPSGVKIRRENYDKSYSPVNINIDADEVDLLVKGYGTGIDKHNKSIKGLGQLLCDLKQNDIFEMLVKLPKLFYGKTFTEQVRNGFWRNRHICFLCCGTGIAPFIQMIRYIFSNSHNGPTGINVSLVFANKTINDIILKDELLALTREQTSFKASFLVSRENDNNIHEAVERQDYAIDLHKGRVSLQLLRNFLENCKEEFADNKDSTFDEFICNTTFMVCGTDEFLETVSGNVIKVKKTIEIKGKLIEVKDKKQGEVRGLLKELGVKSNQVLRF